MQRQYAVGGAASWRALPGCRAAEVGYAGLKDRRAIAVQWFSVPRAARPPTVWHAVRDPDFEVLEAHPHHRKLPRGALAGNRFARAHPRRRRRRRRRGRGARLPRSSAASAAIARGGVPNYFGPQRFGRDGANLVRRAGGRPPAAPRPSAASCSPPRAA